jgi:hypothetical protein
MSRGEIMAHCGGNVPMISLAGAWTLIASGATRPGDTLILRLLVSLCSAVMEILN